MAEKEKVVVAKRGCTCCGTGCVVMGLLAPLGTFALWETLGVLASLGIWLGVFATAHLVRHVSGHPKRIIS